MISEQTQYEAQKWWYENYVKKYGRKDFRDMTIVEKKKVFLAYLESVVGYGAPPPKYEPVVQGSKSYEEDIKSIYEDRKNAVSGSDKSSRHWFGKLFGIKNTSKTSPLPEYVAKPKPAETKEPESNFCENCGNSLKKIAKFCGKCGTARS